MGGGGSRGLLLALLLTLLLGCRGAPGQPTPTLFPPTPLPPTPFLPTATLPNERPMPPTSTPTPLTTWQLPYPHRDGNPLVADPGKLPTLAPLDIPLDDGVVVWLMAVSLPEGSGWIVAYGDGRVRGWHVVGRTVEPLPLAGHLPPEQPPLIAVTGEQVELLSPPMAGLAPVVPPLPIAASWWLVGAEGELLYWQDNQVQSLDLQALPDARPLVDAEGRVLLLSDPTTRYGHAVLGDGIEAGGFALLASRPEPRLLLHQRLEGTVIEGLRPIWVDLDGDGRREILVTESDEVQGAQLVLYDESGTLLARGPAVGRGNRWRHQLAIAPFGPAGELEIVEVLTPHIGGIVNFYRWQGDRLEIVASLPGYSTHRLGARGLDSVLAGDLDGEGQVELLLPTQDMTELAALRRTPEGVALAWSLPLPGTLQSNLVAHTLPDGTLVLGAATEDTLRLWLPEGD